MNVDRDIEAAEAQLALAKANRTFLEAKAAHAAGDLDRDGYHKAQQKFVKVRDNWRENFRTAPDGPGDGTVSPQPHAVKLTAEEAKAGGS